MAANAVRLNKALDAVQRAVVTLNVVGEMRQLGCAQVATSVEDEDERPLWAVVILAGTPTQNQLALDAINEVFEPSVVLDNTCNEE